MKAVGLSMSAYVSAMHSFVVWLMDCKNTFSSRTSNSHRTFQSPNCHLEHEKNSSLCCYIVFLWIPATFRGLCSRRIAIPCHTIPCVMEFVFEKIPRPNDAKAETPVLWPPHAKSWLIRKDSDAGRDWGQEEKGMTEDEMAGWYHWLDGCESEWTLGVGDGQGGLACCDSWGPKESDMTERLNWTELMWDVISFHSSFPYPAVEIVVSNIFKKKINTKNHGLLQLETTLEITDSVHLNIHVKKWQPRADNCSCREPVTEWGL